MADFALDSPYQEVVESQKIIRSAVFSGDFDVFLIRLHFNGQFCVGRRSVGCY
jgi:hypothetical protein